MDFSNKKNKRDTRHLLLNAGILSWIFGAALMHFIKHINISAIVFGLLFLSMMAFGAFLLRKTYFKDMQPWVIKKTRPIIVNVFVILLIVFLCHTYLNIWDLFTSSYLMIVLFLFPCLVFLQLIYPSLFKKFSNLLSKKYYSRTQLKGNIFKDNEFAIAAWFVVLFISAVLFVWIMNWVKTNGTFAGLVPAIWILSSLWCFMSWMKDKLLFKYCVFMIPHSSKLTDLHESSERNFNILCVIFVLVFNFLMAVFCHLFLYSTSFIQQPATAVNMATFLIIVMHIFCCLVIQQHVTITNLQTLSVEEILSSQQKESDHSFFIDRDQE